MSTPKTVILSAPQGWGKTRNAQALREEFGAKTVVDGWDPSQRLTPGALHLTNVRFGHFKDQARGATLVERGWKPSEAGSTHPRSSTPAAPATGCAGQTVGSPT